MGILAVPCQGCKPCTKATSCVHIIHRHLTPTSHTDISTETQYPPSPAAPTSGSFGAPIPTGPDRFGIGMNKPHGAVVPWSSAWPCTWYSNSLPLAKVHTPAALPTCTSSPTTTPDNTNALRPFERSSFRGTASGRGFWKELIGVYREMYKPRPLPVYLQGDKPPSTGVYGR